VRNKDYLLLQMAEGGILVPLENGSIKYLPPARGDDVGERQIELWAMFPNYEDGVRQTQDEDTFATIKHYYKGTLVPQDDAEGGSTIATIGFLYNASAQYIDPDGGENVQPEIDKMSIPDWRQFILKDCVKPNPTALMVMVKPASALTMGQATINMVKNQVAYNTLGTTPANASGYAVSFSAPEDVTDLELSFDPDTKRVRIKTGSTSGTEVVTVTLTNGDAAGSAVTTTFTVVVAA
jgi:hypothetical protein